MGGDTELESCSLCEDAHPREAVERQPWPLWSLGAEQQPKTEVTLRQIPTQYQMAWGKRNLGTSKQIVSLCRSGWTSASTHCTLDTLPRLPKSCALCNLTLPLWLVLLDHFFTDKWSSGNRGNRPMITQQADGKAGI